MRYNKRSLKYAPSKKIIIVFILLLALAGGFWFFSGKNQNNKNSPLKTAIFQIIDNAGNLDYDKDGLKDWEETLWKTDIENPDTDGDGILDGEEIKLGRNPTKAGPNDELMNAKDVLSGENQPYYPYNANLAGSANLTQQFAQNIGSEIISKSETGEQLGDLESLDFTNLETSRNMAEFIAEFYPRIPISELNISGENSLESDQKYVNEIKEVFSKYSYPEDPEDVLVTPLQTKDFTAIDRYINSLEKTVTDLKKIAAPSDFFQIHKQMLESLIGIKKTYESIKQIETDPIKTLIGIEQNEKITEKMQDLITDFLSLAQAKGVRL